MFVFETVFISEKIPEYNLGALLVISHTFVIKLSVLSYMILKLGLKIVWKIFIKILYGFKKHSGWVVLVDRP